jgi:O-methyltransferase
MELLKDNFDQVQRIKDLVFGARYALTHLPFVFADEVTPAELVKFARISRYTRVPMNGLKALCECIRSVEARRIDGAFVECGVWRGGTAALLVDGAGRQSRPVWLFDSFQGMPEATEHDDCGRSDALSGGRRGGRLVSTGTNVATKEYFQFLAGTRLELDMASVHVVEGWFQETLPRVNKDIGPIALLRLDGDFYESTKVILEQLYEQVAPGGVVLVDDYHSFSGCKKAIDEMLGDRTRDFVHIPGKHGVWFIK